MDLLPGMQTHISILFTPHYQLPCIEQNRTRSFMIHFKEAMFLFGNLHAANFSLPSMVGWISPLWMVGMARMG